MEFKNLIHLVLNEKERAEFIDQTSKINIYRGKLYCKFIIFIELILCLIDIFLNYSYTIKAFKFNNYLVMYLIMIIVNIIYLLFLDKVSTFVKNLKRTNNIIVSYVAFMMIWGATVSLMDQKIYGQIVVYMVNVIACSVIYYLDNKTVVALYCISAFTLFLGLPFFQQSKAIIIGHCINCAIFLLFSYLASRILYKNLYSDFKSKRLIMETNEKLKNEIEENKMIHRQLEKANKKLKELSLKDELTNLYNRRALREFIDSICSSDFKQKPLSIIMIDIDNFKLYNDKYGHIKGDEVLKKVSGKLNETLRDSINFVARYGGEEFICIFLETDNNEIYEIANKIREKICGLKIAHTYSNVSNYVTISLGMATTIIPYNANLIHQCIKNADIALYKAKNEGKNRIVNYNTIT